MLNLDSIVSYREDIDTTDIDEDKVMMDLEKGQYFALNSVGSRIWEEIQSPVKISEVVNTLLSEYDVDRETCEKSVMEFIEGVQIDNIRKKMFVALVVPQNIFFNAKSVKVRISLRTFLKSFSGNPIKKGNDQMEIIYNFVKKYMKM